VIRPSGDPRVHFALNCMVVSCPRLPRTAFTAAALDRELDRAARSFIAENRNVRLDPQNRLVYLSAIFDRGARTVDPRPGRLGLQHG